ncbi:hypothetical protein SDC49_11760 [Lactobacillus sp. R2/2]|nr:hypothetical protein [Lactobacillus sp. R2/2]
MGGGLLLISFPGKVFEKIVPFLVLLSAVGLIMTSGKKVVRINQEKELKEKFWGLILVYF